MKKDFENAKTEVQGVHYSRYIASWLIRGADQYIQKMNEMIDKINKDEEPEEEP